MIIDIPCHRTPYTFSYFNRLGMWKDAIEPLVESVDSFNKIHDDKGTSSSLGLLTKCLKKLTMADYNEMKQKYPTMFSQSHPCYEAYVKGMDAVKYIVDLGQTLYVAKHQVSNIGMVQR